MRNQNSWLVFLIYLVLGLYFINYTINYVDIPKVINNFNSWIFIIGGILILLGGINHLRLSRRHILR